MKKMTFMFAMLLMAVVSFAQELVIPPSEAFFEEYLFEGTRTGNGGTPTTVNVAVVGNDVYMQGLAECAPDAYVKGTMSGNQVTFTGRETQYMGVYDGNKAIYFERDRDQVVFTYDAENDEYTCDNYEVGFGSFGAEVYNNVRIHKEQPMTADELIALMTITPEDGSTQASLKTFTLTFPAAVTIDDTQLPTLNNVEGTLSIDETGKVVTAEFEEVTEPGVYTLLIPFGAVLYNGLPIDDFEYEYNVLPEPELSWTINPAEGKVESLKNFTLTFKDGSVTFNTTGYTDPTLTKDGENVFEPGRIYAKSSSAVQVFDITFGSMSSEDDAITEDGTYVLTIHAADFTNKKTGEAIAEEDLVYTFTIGEGGDEPGDEPGVEPGENELVQLPAGVIAEEYQYKAVKPAESIFPAEDITRTVQVAFNGNDVYVQGMSADYADAWVKGTRNGENITFAKNQYVGLYEQSILGTVVASYPVYFNVDNDVVFAYDEANNKLTADAYVINELMADGGYTTTENYTAVEIFKEGGDQPGDEPGVEPGDNELVTPPATAEQKDYLFEANNKYYTSTTYNRAAKVAVDGNDVYFQGLSSQMPEAWVKGTMSDGNVTVAGKQFLGTYVEDNTAFGGEKKEFDLYFSPEGENVVFAYNAEEDAYTTAAYGIDVTTDALGKNEDYINVKIYTEPFDVMDYVAIDPEEGEVEAIGAFTVTFGDYEVTKTSPVAVASLKNNTTEEEFYAPILIVANKKVMLSYEETTTPGEYTLNIPAGSLKLTVDEKEVEVPELNFNYTIAEPVVFSWTIDPEEGQVEGLTNVFNIQFENGNVTYDYTQADPTLTKDGESLAEFASMSISNSQKATLYFGSVSQTINYTEDGTYVLTIPAGTLKNNGEAMKELTFTWTIGEVVNPGDDEPVVLPATATVEDWTLEGSLYASGGIQTVKEATKVAFDGEDIYVQGLCQYLPEAWVKGTFADGKAVLKSGQMFGTIEEEGESYNFYMMGATADDQGYLSFVDEVVLNYDADAEKFTLEDGVYIVDNSNNTEPAFYDLFMALILTKGAYVAPEVVELPEDAVAEDWTYEAYDAYYQETVTRPSQVAFVGNDVYVNAISEAAPEAWIKGTLEGDKVTFAANQYLGNIEGYYSSFDLFFNPDADVVFTYDAEAGKLTAAEYVTFTGSYNYDEMTDVVITKVAEVAAVPATPTIDEVVISTYSYVDATIPATSVDGEPLAASKLTYMILVEKAKDQSEPFVLSANNYPYEEDMTEIPYMFNDSENLYIQASGDMHRVYLMTDAEELDSWYRLGLKSIYAGGGEVNESEITWYTIKEYTSTGINEIGTEEEGSVYFDAMGRRINGEAKGLVIKQVRTADGVKAVKMVRK